MFWKKRKTKSHKIVSPLKKSRLKRRKKNLTYHNSPHKRPGKRFTKENPSFQRFKKIAVITFIFLTFGATVRWIYFSDYFNLENIEIINEKVENQILNASIKNELGEYLGQNLLKVDKEEIKNTLATQFKVLDNIEIDKNLPDKLEISFTEYPLVANLIHQGENQTKTYIINSIGYVIKEDVENSSLPYIKIESIESINIDKPAIEPVNLKYILDSVANFTDKFGMRVVEVDYKKTAREIHLLTENNFYIWLDIQKPAEDQLKKLKKASIKLDIYKQDLQYVDLRIAGKNGNRIFYR